MAINGASGPSTTPRARVTKAATAMPGSSIPVGAPPTVRPLAGS